MSQPRLRSSTGAKVPYRHKHVAMHRILVIEDNQTLVAKLFAYLEPRHYSLDAAQNGATGLHLALTADYDAIILDWMLPQLDGQEVVKRMRSRGCATPVLMLTARDDLPHKIAGFRAGADDYVTKPFEFGELEVRLEALILRTKGRTRVLKVADLTFDLATQTVTRAGAVLQLYAGGRKLLEALMHESPAVVGRERLESILWGEEPPDQDMLRSHIYQLRKAVDGPFATKLIHTVAKVGYRLAASEPTE
jgi:DNA-binding response OmpR family regulator